MTKVNQQKAAADAAGAKSNSESFKKNLRRYGGYYTMLVLPILYFIIFKYLPMIGNVLAFRRYSAAAPLFGTEWVGMTYFKQFLSSSDFWQKFKNTLLISTESLVFTFPIPIIFALLLNEVKNVRFKKFVQTASYLPHFLSMVVVAGLIFGMLSVNGGTINLIRKWMGLEAINFLMEPQWFRTIYIVSNVWQEMGWNAIIYIAAISGIDDSLYEAGMIDGANRFQQTIFITLPSISGTVVISLILAVGGMLSVGSEKILLLMNDLNKETADVISTYVYRLGLIDNNYSYSTAVGLFDAVIGLILVGGANLVSRRITGTSLW